MVSAGRGNGRDPVRTALHRQDWPSGRMARTAFRRRRPPSWPWRPGSAAGPSLVRPRPPFGNRELPEHAALPPLDSPESPSSGGSTGRRSWRATLPVSSPLTFRRQSSLGRELDPWDGLAAVPSVLPRRARLLPAHVLAGRAKRLPRDVLPAWATWRARQRTPLNRRTSKTRPCRAGAATRALWRGLVFWACRTDGAKGGQAWKSATRSSSFTSRASFFSRSFMSLRSLRASSSSTILPYSSNSSTVS